MKQGKTYDGVETDGKERYHSKVTSAVLCLYRYDTYLKLLDECEFILEQKLDFDTLIKYKAALSVLARNFNDAMTKCNKVKNIARIDQLLNECSISKDELLNQKDRYRSADLPSLYFKLKEVAKLLTNFHSGVAGLQIEGEIDAELEEPWFEEVENDKSE